MKRRSLQKFLLTLLAVAFLVSAAPAVAAPVYQEDEKGKKEGKKSAGKRDSKENEGGKKLPGRDLEAWGTLKEVKGTGFHTLDYTKVEGRKASKQSVFVKIPEDADFYTDKPVKLTDLKEGDTVWLFGRPVENEVPGKGGGGSSGPDRQIQNVSAIVGGEGLRVNVGHRDSVDPKLKWCETTVAKPGASITVKYDGGDYKVVMGKAPPILVREKTGDAKALKSGVRVEVSGDKTDEKPETKSASDAKKESFTAKKVVILDRRLLASLYPMLLE